MADKKYNKRLPTLIGIGPSRTATTWLHDTLQGHVGLPRRTKELFYFSTNYTLGIEWYSYHFRDYPPSMVLGEITPTYFDYRESPSRIARDLTDYRIVCSLRDPVSRIYSHYRLLRSVGWISRQTFLEALESHEKWLDQPGNLIGTNRYAFHLKRWFEQVGRENVLVTFVDDLRKDTQQYLDQITGFIGAPRIELSSLEADRRINPRERAPLHPHLAARARRLKNALERRQLYRTVELLEPFFRYCFGRGEYFEELDPRTVQMLRERFRPEVQALEDLLNRDLSHWRDTTG
jgi:hypothetical protein